MVVFLVIFKCFLLKPQLFSDCIDIKHGFLSISTIVMQLFSVMNEVSQRKQHMLTKSDGYYFHVLFSYQFVFTCQTGILFWAIFSFYRKLETHWWPSPMSYPPPVTAPSLCRSSTTGTAPQNTRRRRKRRGSRQRTFAKPGIKQHFSFHI